MNREPTSSSSTAPRAPRRWKSSNKSSDLSGLGHIGESDPVASAPCRTKSSDELDEDLLTPYPHKPEHEAEDDDVSMQDVEMEICPDDAASVGSFSHCSGEGRAPLVATDSSMSFTRSARRHVSATDSCLSLFSTDSLHQMRFIAPTNSFTPQDIIMMEDEERIRSTSFRLSFASTTEKGLPTDVSCSTTITDKKDVVDSTTTPQNQQPPALWKSLPFATNQGLPDFNSSAVSYEEGEAPVMRRKPPVQRKTSIYRAPAAGVASS